MKFLQKLGKALMLPIAVMPICGVLMGIGYLMCPASMQGGDIAGVIPTIGYILTKAGGAVINNIAWLFVIGVSVGMSDDKNGSVCLAGLVNYLMVITLLSPAVVSGVIGPIPEDSATFLAFSKIQNPFIAILCGILAAVCYNKFKNKTLPDFLAFFSGRRFVVIISALISILLAVLLAFIWPLVFEGLMAFGKAIISIGGFGAGIYASANRMLLPFGLHHALNNVFWFDTVGIGDLTNFWAGKTSADVGWSLGMYMSGFFPCMMFGVPGAALAMIKNAKNKKKAKSILISAAVCAFFCGVTEPFEFLFMYECFPLYIVYALLYGIFTIVVYYVGFRAGFSFSGGATDLLFSASLPASARTWLIIPLGVAAFLIFYLVFSFMIKKFNIMTPGRDEDEIPLQDVKFPDVKVKRTANETAGAAALVKALGGADNIVTVDCCATRLRLQLKDSSLVNRQDCKKHGAVDVIIPDKESCQVIIGVTVQQVCDAVKEELENPSAGAARRMHVTHTDIIVGGNMFYTIRDPLGIHARPAGALVEVSKKYECNIVLAANGKEADAKSILEIMSLGVKQNDIVEVRADGKDAGEARAAVLKYLREHF